MIGAKNEYKTANRHWPSVDRGFGFFAEWLCRRPRGPLLHHWRTGDGPAAPASGRGIRRTAGFRVYLGQRLLGLAGWAAHMEAWSMGTPTSWTPLGAASLGTGRISLAPQPRPLATGLGRHRLSPRSVLVAIQAVFPTSGTSGMARQSAECGVHDGLGNRCSCLSLSHYERSRVPRVH